MKAQIEKVVSAKEVAEARRKARALRNRVAHRRSGAKIEVDVGTLRVILKVADAASPGGSVMSKGSEDASLGDEISPQEAADIADVAPFRHAPDRDESSASAQSSVPQQIFWSRGCRQPTKSLKATTSGA